MPICFVSLSEIVFNNDFSHYILLCGSYKTGVLNPLSLSNHYELKKKSDVFVKELAFRKSQNQFSMFYYPQVAYIT